ncbi:hypothetical protein [Natrinema longum]|uniref:Uncharacterized protein n=1 Tax=Natrinema longum TaxID=370324 RepID=A0A8A2UD82_9EURY|nr:hypothetical protein [Natrinema longum]MBZ6495595.1 hypothetical protein [Natrinema longum]QSW86442.1 hypothetical protein J0X27_06390 [Natrinema longum]
MSAALGLLVVLASLAVPFVLWLAISRETSDPTVVDRAEAERIAKERGGRETAHSSDGVDHPDDDDRDEWGDRRT